MIKIKKKNLFLLEKKKKIIFFNSIFCNTSKIIFNNIKKIEKKYKIIFFYINIEENINFCIKNNINCSPSILFDLDKKVLIKGFLQIKDILKNIIIKR